MGERHYIKKNGKYIPQNDPYALDGLYNGSWLVTVTKGCTAIKQQLDPKFVELDAALYYLQEELCRFMIKESELRNPNRTSKKEQKAWKAFKKTMGKDMPVYFSYPSFHQIATQACKKLKQIMIQNDMDIIKISQKYAGKKGSVDSALDNLEI